MGYEFSQTSKMCQNPVGQSYEKELQMAHLQLSLFRFSTKEFPLDLQIFILTQTCHHIQVLSLGERSAILCLDKPASRGLSSIGGTLPMLSCPCSHAVAAT